MTLHSSAARCCPSRGRRLRVGSVGILAEMGGKLVGLVTC